VDDWVTRIEKLCAAVEGWLPAGWKAEHRRLVHMDEIMMRMKGVPGRDLPVRDLERSGNPRDISNHGGFGSLAPMVVLIWCDRRGITSSSTAQRTSPRRDGVSHHWPSGGT
jgi:hypothetical protein